MTSCCNFRIRIQFNFIVIGQVTSTEQQHAVCIHPEALRKYKSFVRHARLHVTFTVDRNNVGSSTCVQQVPLKQFSQGLEAVGLASTATNSMVAKTPQNLNMHKYSIKRHCIAHR